MGYGLVDREEYGVVSDAFGNWAVGFHYHLPVEAGVFWLEEGDGFLLLD